MEAAVAADVDADAEVAGCEGADDVTTGVVVVAGGVEGGEGVADAVADAVAGAFGVGGVTTRLRHSPWLPEVSTAATCTETSAVRWGHETVVLVSAVFIVLKPSPLITYSFTATLS